MSGRQQVALPWSATTSEVMLVVLSSLNSPTRSGQVIGPSAWVWEMLRLRLLAFVMYMCDMVMDAFCADEEIELIRGTFEAIVIEIVFCEQGQGADWLMSLTRKAAGQTSMGQASPAIAPKIGSSVVTSGAISNPFSLCAR